MPPTGMHKRTFARGGKPDMTALLLGYARVSKADDQTNSAQAHALRSAGCHRILEEMASGGFCHASRHRRG